MKSPQLYEISNRKQIVESALFQKGIIMLGKSTVDKDKCGF